MGQKKSPPTRHLAVRLEIVQRSLEATAVRAQKAEDAFRLRLADGYSTGGEGPSTLAPDSDVRLTTPEAAVDSRWRAHPEFQEMLRLLGVLIDTSRELGRRVDRVLVEQDPQEKARLRCTGGMGEKGALEWGVPECRNIAEPNRTAGLCVGCRLARDRWQRGQSDDHFDPKAYRAS